MYIVAGAGKIFNLIYLSILLRYIFDFLYITGHFFSLFRTFYPTIYHYWFPLSKELVSKMYHFISRKSQFCSLPKQQRRQHLGPCPGSYYKCLADPRYTGLVIFVPGSSTTRSAADFSAACLFPGFVRGSRRSLPLLNPFWDLPLQSSATAGCQFFFFRVNYESQVLSGSFRPGLLFTSSRSYQSILRSAPRLEHL